MFDKIINKIKHKPPTVFLDPRLVEKILHSDLWEYIEKRINVLTGKKSDSYYGKKIPNDPIKRFFIEISAVNSGILTRNAFEGSGLSEDVINAIFDGHQIIFGAKPPRFVKALVWNFMCHREHARLAFLRHDKKNALEVGDLMANTIRLHPYIDWGTAIREFWEDETRKNYDNYIITNH